MAEAPTDRQPNPISKFVPRDVVQLFAVLLLIVALASGAFGGLLLCFGCFSPTPDHIHWQPPDASCSAQNEDRQRWFDEHHEMLEGERRMLRSSGAFLLGVAALSGLAAFGARRLRLRL